VFGDEAAQCAALIAPYALFAPHCGRLVELC